MSEKYKAVATSGKAYKLILKIKATNEYAVFDGYQLGSHGSGIVAEIVDSLLIPLVGLGLLRQAILKYLTLSRIINYLQI